jgi:hypothetical protein
MDYPDPFWLTVTNIVLGFSVVLALLALVNDLGREVLAKRKKRRAAMDEIDRDLRQFLRHAGHPR